ncbi:MAG: hypothetical protein Q8903_03555 [Bacteroidota bacterium]|nr:hypothetical protein [Bacteroidota bacterium]
MVGIYTSFLWSIAGGYHTFSPAPPAFTVMIFLQIAFGLSLWPVILIGVAGSAIGRLVLSKYIDIVAKWVLKPEKNEDIRLLGEKIRTKGLKAQLFILLYTLLPVSSTPLFIASGMARIEPLYIIPAFITGKFTSDSIAVIIGKYTLENANSLFKNPISWQSGTALLLFLLLMFALLFTDWRTLIHQHKFHFKFNIWK